MSKEVTFSLSEYLDLLSCLVESELIYFEADWEKIQRSIQRIKRVKLYTEEIKEGGAFTRYQKRKCDEVLEFIEKSLMCIKKRILEATY